MKKSDKKPPAKKSGRGNVIQMINNALSFFGCVLIALILMYYVNGTFGILIAASLLCAFTLSVVMTLITSRFIRAELRLDKTSVSKGDTVKCVISVKKDILLAAPFVELHLESSPKLRPETDLCQISLAGSETNDMDISAEARFSGAAEVFVSVAYLVDYLGIFKIRLKNLKAYEHLKLAIYPDIPDVPVQTDFIKEAVLSASDDDEEETDETALGFTGMPGYEHREYFPGDPIKRINWKLSSKRGVYMIRLDEMTTGSGQVFFLDSPKSEENEYTLGVRDTVIEGMLAVFKMLVAEGRDAVFFFVRNKTWQQINIHSIADITELQELLSECDMYTPQNPVPEALTGIGKIPVCFTASTDSCCQSAIDIASQIPEVLMVSALSAKLPSVAAKGWVLTDALELKKQ